jgi:hypothetical protein
VRHERDLRETVAGMDPFPLSPEIATSIAESLNDRRVRQFRTSAEPALLAANRVTESVPDIHTNPLAQPLFELLLYVGGWDIEDPDHPVVKARKAYEASTRLIVDSSRGKK